jgi:hypothetical protein
LKTKCELNKWIRFRGGLKQLAEKHGTSADELKRVGNIKTNGMRGEHARIYIQDVNAVVSEPSLPCEKELTEDKCVAFLKSLGYKLMKPVNEWVEI